MKSKAVLSSILIVLFIWSCGAESTVEEPAQQPLNPNGDSELALLMRAIFDDALRMKEQVQKGHAPTSELEFEKILTADPTDPEQVGNDTYRAFGDAYIEQMRALLDGGVIGAQDKYTSIVNTCMNCHSALCPGPRVRIKKLYLET